MQTEHETFTEAKDIQAILGMRRIAVVGLSSDSWKAEQWCSPLLAESRV